MAQTNIQPPIPEPGDYFYWDPTQGFTFPLDGGEATAEITLEPF
jgi:hypothetical protein